jgi:ATP-binding cassette, subfamily B, bacterial PglK
MTIQKKSLIKLYIRLWKHISSVRRRQFFLLLLLTIICSFAEIVSLASVVPFIAIITQPEIIFDYPFIESFVKIFGIEEGVDLVIPLSIAFLVASIMSGLLRMLLVWVGLYTCNSTGADFGVEIYRRTLYQPYHVQIGRSSSEVLSGMTQKIGAATGAVTTLVTVVTSGMLFLAIISTIFLINPLLASSSILIFGSAYVLIALLTKYRVSSNGERIARKESQLVKMIQEGLGSIRDILLDGTQKTFYKEYKRGINALVKGNTENAFMNAAPRYFMETLGIVLVSFIVIAMSFSSDGSLLAIPILGVLALGAQRSLPLMQQLYAGWNSILGGKASMADVLDLLDQPLPSYVNLPEPEPMVLKQSVRFDNVSFSYGKDFPKTLNNINLEFPKGSRIGVIGPTGCGKSTMLDILMGMLEPTEGSIQIDDKPIDATNQRAWQRAVAHVPQNIFLTDATIAENIALGIPINKIDLDSIKIASQKACMSEFIESCSEGYYSNVGERGIWLSGGQRQRIGIARALYKNASVLIFDEATSALDNETEQSVMQAIEELDDDITLFIIAHRLTTLKKCTHIVELSEGKVKRIGGYHELIDS